jgi:hypothetical protein
VVLDERLSSTADVGVAHVFAGLFLLAERVL